MRYSWRDPLGRFGMTQFVDVGPETTIWTFDPLCWSTNLLLCRKNPNVHFVVSPILSDTLCWFGSNNESTICTIDQFCWCGWLFLKSTFLTVDKFCWFVVDTESTIFVNWPDLTKSTDRLTLTQINLLDGKMDLLGPWPQCRSSKAIGKNLGLFNSFYLVTQLFVWKCTSFRLPYN